MTNNRSEPAVMSGGRRRKDNFDEDAMANAEKLGFVDFFVGVLLGGVVFFLQWLWEFPGIHPALWDSSAVAAGVRPAASLVPGYAIAISSAVYNLCGFSFGNFVLRMAGHAILALSTMCVYLFLREVLTFVMRARPQSSPRRRQVMMVAALVGAASFAASDPVWSAGQFFGETTLLLAMSVAAVEFFFAFLRKGMLKYSYVCAVILGLLAAETPAGIAIVVVFIAMNFIVIKIFPNLESPFFKPALIEVGKWHMTFFLLAAFVAGIALNCVSYIMHDGLLPTGESIGALPLKYLLMYANRAKVAASVAGWILLVGIALGPLIVAMVRFSAAADEENFLSYPTGIVFLFCGALAFSQCASLSALWFWTYVGVQSSYLLSLCTLMCAITISLSITILGVDSLCRDHRRLARRIFGQEEEEVTEEDEMVMSPGMTERLRKLGIVVVPCVLLAALLPGRLKNSTREMLRLVNDVIKATVDEAGKAGFIFTDGNLDPALELESLARGGSLKCVSLMGGSANEVWLRTRGLTDAEDKLSFRFDGAMGLRSWIRDKPECLSNAAVQVGFDLWKRDGKPLPPIGGLLSHPLDNDEVARSNAVVVARALAARAISIYDAGIGNSTEQSVKRVFFDTEWRLSRMSLYRAEYEDLIGDAESAKLDMTLSRNLNERNETFKALIKANEKRNEQMMRRLTPREGLQLALVRADFTLGKVYAEAILSADLENPDANFALGMYYYKEDQYSRAADFFKRCLIRRPDEPAIYNNLAIVQMKQGNLDAASINIERALELVPGSAEVMDTKKQIDQAKSLRDSHDRLRPPPPSHDVLAP